jgi:hypothetical protein
MQESTKKENLKVWFHLYYHDLNGPLFPASYASPQQLNEGHTLHVQDFLVNNPNLLLQLPE